MAGSMPDLSLGSRSSRKLTWIWEPSGFISMSSGSPIRMCSTHGATLARTNLVLMEYAAPASSQMTSARSSSTRIERTPALRRMSAPARIADPARPSDSAPMPPTGTQLVGGAGAHHRVEEGAVLAQSAVVHRGEGAAQGVGGDHAAHGVVGEPALEDGAERGRRELAERGRVEGLGDLALGGQRLQHRRPHHPGHRGDLAVERAPHVVLAAAVAQVDERVAGRPALRALDDEGLGLPVARHRRVRRHRPRGELHPDVEVVEDLLRQQRDHRRVLRDPGGVPVEHGRVDGGAADAGAALEDQDLEPGSRQVGRPRRGRCARRRPRRRRRSSPVKPRCARRVKTGRWGCWNIQSSTIVDPTCPPSPSTT